MAIHPEFLPGESRGHGSLVGYSSQSHNVSDMTEVTQHKQDRVSLFPHLTSIFGIGEIFALLQLVHMNKGR